MLFKSLSNLKVQIALGFGLLLVLLVVISGFGVSNGVSALGKFSDYRSTARSSILLADMQEDILSARMTVMKYRATRQEGALSKVQAEMAAMVEEAELLKGCCHIVFSSRMSG
ncbi:MULTISPECIES: hypothetical protein [unclassified Roseibium]|uniref:hypothetical protein n=1 Tax=unclassified Roseibium TaxID=2629323 RepID=UPI00273E1BC3|nr:MULTISPECIES: hypothetical protein [unclassified Roseibium]